MIAQHTWPEAAAALRVLLETEAYSDILQGKDKHISQCLSYTLYMQAHALVLGTKYTTSDASACAVLWRYYKRQKN